MSTPKYGFDTKDRIADITTATSIIRMDLLLSQIHIRSTHASGSDSEKNCLLEFATVGRVEIGRPILFRLATDRPLLTSPATSIEWLGPQDRIDPRDIEAMKIIGDMLTKSQRPKRWWRRD